MLRGWKGWMKHVLRLLENCRRNLLIIRVEEEDLDGPCALRVAFDAGWLVAIKLMSAHQRIRSASAKVR